MRSGRPVTSVPVAGLLDVAAGVRLVQEGGLLRVLVRPGVELTVSGEDARLSDTGEFMVASVPVDGRRRLDTEVLDVASGVAVLLALPPSGTTVAAAFGPETSVTFLRVNDELDSIDDPRMADQPAYDLATCFLRSRVCLSDGRVTTVPERPILAQ